MLVAVGVDGEFMSYVVDMAVAIGHGDGMRLQLAIDVADLNEAIDFYGRLFGAGPDKVEDGYANWALTDPPLKFVVFERPDAPAGGINHLGLEVESADEVVATEERLRGAGLMTTGIDETMCCFAEKVETWVTDPNGHRWEVYVKTADHPTARENVVLTHRSTTAGMNAEDAATTNASSTSMADTGSLAGEGAAPSGRCCS